MANVDLQEPLWPDATTQGVMRLARNVSFAPGRADSLPTAAEDYEGAIHYIPGAASALGAHAVCRKTTTDTYTNGYLVPAYLPNGVTPAVQYATVITPTALAGDTTDQNVFAAANDLFTVSADTSYFFDALYHLTTGTTTHTTSVIFALTTATLTSIKYTSIATSQAANALATPQMRSVAVATTVAVTATSTAADTIIKLDGIIRVNAGGTITPQISFSADPVGGTHTVNVNSYFKIWPVGSKTLQAMGLWA